MPYEPRRLKAYLFLFLLAFCLFQEGFWSSCRHHRGPTEDEEFAERVSLVQISTSPLSYYTVFDGQGSNTDSLVCAVWMWI